MIVTAISKTLNKLFSDDIHDRIFKNVVLGVSFLRQFGEVSFSAEHDVVYCGFLYGEDPFEDGEIDPDLVSHIEKEDGWTPTSYPVGMSREDYMYLFKIGWHYDEGHWEKYV